METRQPKDLHWTRIRSALPQPLEAPNNTSPLPGSRCSLLGLQTKTLERIAPAGRDIQGQGHTRRSARANCDTTEEQTPESGEKASASPQVVSDVWAHGVAWLGFPAS